MGRSYSQSRDEEQWRGVIGRSYREEQWGGVIGRSNGEEL